MEVKCGDTLASLTWIDRRVNDWMLGLSVTRTMEGGMRLDRYGSVVIERQLNFGKDMMLFRVEMFREILKR